MTAALLEDYGRFLRAKATVASNDGFDINPADINPILKPHQRLHGFAAERKVDA